MADKSWFQQQKLGLEGGLFYSRTLQVSFWDINYRQLCLFCNGIFLRKQQRKKKIFLHFHQLKLSILESLAKPSNILAKIYEITFYHQPLVRYVQRSGNNLFEREKVFQIIHIALPTEEGIKSSTFIFQTFCLNFKSTYTILKELMNGFWNDFKRTPHDGCLCQYVLYRNWLQE